jgi:hypothetical protein
MKKTTWRFIVLALLVLSFPIVGCANQEEKNPAPAAESGKGSPPAAAQKKTQPLFIIERSKNANVVHYDAQLTGGGEIDLNEPVIAYWIMLATDGHREELNWIEKKKAYGFSVKPEASVKGYKMTIVAVPDHPITIRKVGDAVRAELVIEGRPSIFEKMYINATDRLIGPKVHYVELYGKDLKTGEKRYEKIEIK